MNTRTARFAAAWAKNSDIHIKIAAVVSKISCILPFAQGSGVHCACTPVGKEHSLTQNPPHQHHYIPSFYLSKWAIFKDRRLCQFSKPHHKVVPQRKHPQATGFSDKLYELKGLSPELANAIEEKFFKPIDTHAADALELLVRDGNNAHWDSRRRTGWSIFLHSLLFRTPEDIAAFKESWRQVLQVDEHGEWERKYQALRKPNDASTFREHMVNQSDDVLDRSAMRALISVLDDDYVARAIHHMTWHVIDTSGADFNLLTSDRPIIRTNGLMVDGGHLTIPIGPRRLFIAAKDEASLRQFVSIPLRQLVRENNRQVCDFAVKYVYGVDDSQLAFVAKHFATKHQPRLAKMSEEARREIISTIGPPQAGPTPYE